MKPTETQINGWCYCPPHDGLTDTFQICQSYVCKNKYVSVKTKDGIKTVEIITRPY